MAHLDELRATFPDAARDTKLNLDAVLGVSSLTPDQRWGVAMACALATRNTALRDAVFREARGHVSAAVVEDAIAAATLMAMNNVYYRFRHLVGQPEYSEKPARLRMQRIGKPATNKVDFELLCLAVSAINACESCIRSHEHVVREAGLTDDQVHDAVRIAAVLHASAVALDAVPVAIDTASAMVTASP